MRTVRRVALAVSLMLCAAALSACATGSDASNGVLKVGESAAGTTVNVAVGETIEVALPANPTTGFDWSGERSTDVLALVSDTYVPAPSGGAVGSGGVHTFVFKAASAGQDTVQLQYARPWETGVEPAKTFELFVTVR